MSKMRRSERLIRFMSRASDYYRTVNPVVNIANENMPVRASSDQEELLVSYSKLYGSQDNRLGGFDTSVEYDEFRDDASALSKIPEVELIAARMERARENLQEAILRRGAIAAAKYGYDLREKEGKLFVFSLDKD